MKQWLVLLLLVAAALGGWYGRDLIPKHETEPKEEEHEEHTGVEIENGKVRLDEETEERLGIETSTLEAMTQPSGLSVIGSVLDVSALVALDSDIASANAAAAASKVEMERARGLFANGENVSRKALEAAQSAVRADELKLAALRRRVPLEWGSLLGSLDDTARGALVERLAQGKSCIARVEPLDVSSSPNRIKGAVLRAHDVEIKAARVASAPSRNERTQSVAFLVLLDDLAEPLSVGEQVDGSISMSEETRTGLRLPGNAVVRQGGQPWAYVEQKEREFVRLPVSLSERVKEAWFVSSGDAMKAGTKVVTTGAAALLSAELTAVGQGGAGEP